MIFFHKENIFDNLLMVVPHKIFFQSEIHTAFKIQFRIMQCFKKITTFEMQLFKNAIFWKSDNKLN